MSKKRICSSPAFDLRTIARYCDREINGKIFKTNIDSKIVTILKIPNFARLVFLTASFQPHRLQILRSDAFALEYTVYIP